MMKAGLVGLGWWGSSLLRMTADSEALRIVAATDLDPGREATATAAGAAFRRTFEDVVRDPEVEGVILCTPHEFHAEQAISAAERGKHVFCEKPLCLTLADAERVVQACERAGVVLGIGHERRFEPPIVDLMTRITTGELGTILQIEGNFSQDKFLSLSRDNWRIRGAGSVGPMTATGIHVLDLSTAILGPVTRVAASVRSLATSFENGNSLAVMIDFENGGAALISAYSPRLSTVALRPMAAWGGQIRDKIIRRTLRVGSRPIWSGASPGRSRNILALPRLVSISRPSRGRRRETILSHQDRSDASDDRRARGGVRVDATRRMEAGRLRAQRESFAPKTQPPET